jgi:putative tryptophan/tyrosine transport system substrate-binding protein
VRDRGLRRRDFFSLLTAGAAAGWPALARSQQRPIIGFLSGRSPEGSKAALAAFVAGLAERGFAVGKNIEIEFRWARDRYELLPSLAAELVRGDVTLIVAVGGGITSAQAARRATAKIPIVFVAGSDPVEFGLVNSLNRPGGNMTGVSFIINALLSKDIELIHEVLPRAMAIGLLVNPSFPNAVGQLREGATLAETLGRRLVSLRASTDAELDVAFASVIEQRVGGLVIGADPFLVARAQRLALLAARSRIAGVHPSREFAVAGGLMSYGTSINEAYRQAGLYAATILRGARPGDLPVIQTTKVGLVVNLKAAALLGLTMPPSILARADEVIE